MDFIVFVVLRLFMSPYWIYKAQEERIKNLAIKNDDKINHHAVPLVIKTGKGKNFEEVIPSNGSFVTRTVLVEVSNVNPFFLYNCMIKMMLWQTKHKEKYHIMSDEPFFLPPNGVKYIKVAQYSESVGNKETVQDMRLCIPRRGFGTIEDMIPHETDYQVTFYASCAEAAESTTVTILSVKNGKLTLEAH